MQEEEEREGTWYSNIKKSIKEYKINKNIKEVIKSEWKEEVKDKIRKKAEEEVREECKRLKKTRSVKNDEYEIRLFEEAAIRRSKRCNENEITHGIPHMQLCKFGRSHEVSTMW